MSQPSSSAYQHTPSSFPRFECLPAELRVMVYQFHLHDMISTLPETSLTIEYHFCDKRYEVTSDLNRFRAQNHAGRFLHLVCVGPMLRQGAEPELYDCFKFIVTLNRHWNSLDLSEGDRYMLSHATRLKIYLSDDQICRVMPEHHQRDDQSLYRRVRRGSWDAGSSVTSMLDANNQRLQIARPRFRSWADPDQNTPYIDRLDALFDVFGFGINLNLKSLDIFISDIDRQHDNRAIARDFDRRVFETMLNHIGARVRLRPSGKACVATLHLGQRVGDLLTRDTILQFLNYIQYRSTQRVAFSDGFPTEPRRVVSPQTRIYLLRSALLYRTEPLESQRIDQLELIFGLQPYRLNGLFRHLEHWIPEGEWWTFRLPPL